MSKVKQQGQRGERGIPGPAGPRGKQGPTGATGQTGSAGRVGAKGAIGKTGPVGKIPAADRVELLSTIQGQIDEVSRELTAQMKRTQSLRDDLEALRANVAGLAHGSEDV
jgi:hypothetical protein